MTLQSAALLVSGNVSKLPTKYQTAAISLVAAYQRSPDRFSDKQASFLQSLANMLQPKTAPASIIRLDNIIALFTRASQHLKRPKINLDLHGSKICLSLAGPTARYPGSVNVTDGGSFGNSVFYGRVNLQGGYEQRIDKPGLINLLQNLQGDALELMREQGRRTGMCCLCGRTLTNAVSIANGIGPICQDRFF